MQCNAQVASILAIFSNICDKTERQLQQAQCQEQTPKIWIDR